MVSLQAFGGSSRRKLAFKTENTDKEKNEMRLGGLFAAATL